MKRWMITTAICLVAALLLMACSAGADESGTEGSGITLPAPVDSSAGVPARPGSGVTGDPSVNLEGLEEISGTVKELSSDLVLIALAEDGGDYMLRFSENTTWREGVSTEIATGNTLKCIVKPEPTFTTPSQGEVIEVLVNEKAG